MRRLALLAALCACLLLAPPTAAAPLGFAPAPGSPVPLTGLFGIRNVELADVNGDRRLDILITGSDLTDGKLAIRLGNGSGGFSPPAAGALTDTGVANDANDLVPGDFNRDGRLDVAVSHFGGDAGTDLAVLLRTAAGTYVQAPGSPRALTGNSYELTAAAIDPGSDPDLVVGGPSSVINVLISNGDGSFDLSDGSPVTTGAAANIAVATGDLNGDGRTDIVTGTQGLTSVPVLLGDGTGVFAAAPGSPEPIGGSAEGPSAVAVADLNADRRPDVATANFSSDDASILLNGGGGELAPAVGAPFATGVQQPNAVRAADLDADGTVDLVIPAGAATTTVAALLGNGQGGFAPAGGSPYQAGGGANDVAVGDVDGDLQPDVVTANLNGQSASVLLNTNVPSIAADPGAVAFPEPRLGTTRGASVTIGNGGTGFLRISGAALQGDGAFSVASDGCSGRTLRLGERCTLGLDFAAGAPGSRAGSLVLSGNVPGGSTSVPLSGHSERPAISRVRVRPRAFAPRGRARAGARRRVARRARIRFTLSEPARVRLAIQRALPGRRRAGRCVQPTPRLRDAKRCRRFKTVGSVRATGAAGANSVRFNGRLRRKPLRPGRYRIAAAGRDAAGNRTVAPRYAGFRIVRAR